MANASLEKTIFSIDLSLNRGHDSAFIIISFTLATGYGFPATLLLTCYLAFATIPPMTEERFRDPAQALILLIVGLIFLVPGLLTIFIPISWMADLMQSAHPRRFDGLWPDSPLYFYMIRSMGGFVSWIGVTFLIASRDPSRYKWWIFASGIALILLAALCTAYGHIYRLPRTIYVGDAIFSLLGGILLLKSRPWQRIDSEDTT